MAKKTKRGTPRRAKRTPASKRTPTPKRPVGLSVRDWQQLVPRVEVLPAAPTPPPALERHAGADGFMLGELGLVEIKFTPEEEQILARPVDPAKVRIKPNGAVYYPHPEYTRWMNEAVGRGGWSLIPIGTPAIANKVVVCPYVLFVHGKPIAFAQGEQEYFESNRDQSYGDAIESTVASALRRCMKRLGIGLELWDKDFADTWRDQYAAEVWVRPRDGSPKKQWRRKMDPPFWNEESGREPARHQAPPPPAQAARQEAPPAAHAHQGARISDAQRRRLVALTLNSGRTPEQVTKWLKARYQWNGTAEVTRDKYDEVCQFVERDGELPR